MLYVLYRLVLPNHKLTIQKTERVEKEKDDGTIEIEYEEVD